MNKKNVVFGILGSQLDAGKSANRWESWRPSVAICQQEDLLMDRFELISDRKTRELADIVAADIQSVSPETELRVHEIDFRDPWDLEEVYGQLHQFARNYTFDTDHEDYLVHITTGTHVVQICFFLLTESRHFPGRLLQAVPPRRKNQSRLVGSYRIIDLDLSRFDALATRFEIEQQEDVSFLKSGIDTKNRSFNRLMEQIEKVALVSNSPILLTGPTGAGKTQLARKIFELKKRRQLVSGNFIEVNCATLQGDQARSTLFGHLKGSFTGAMKDREGLLKVAHHGMLFLDEIGELGLDEQAMLLRAIEEGRFLPLGSDQETTSEFQLIAGTNRDLMEEVEQKAFREDLLARINLWTFDLPGLKDRREDIEPNVDFELQKFTSQTGHNVRFNKEARTEFMKFAMAADSPWRGNFRHLSAAINRMATLCHGGRISVEDVKTEKERLLQSWQTKENGENLLRRFFDSAQLANMDLFDQIQMQHVLTVCLASPSMAAAGRRLFNVSRTKKASTNDADRLRKYLARFQLSWIQIQDAKSDR